MNLFDWIRKRILEKRKQLLSEKFFDIDPMQPLREPSERPHEMRSLCWLEKIIMKKRQELREETFFDIDPAQPLISETKQP